MSDSCNPSEVKRDLFVKIEYKIDIEGRDTPDWFAVPNTIEFLFGRDIVPSMIEQAVIGLKEGDVFDVAVDSRESFGPYNPALVVSFLLKDLPDGLDISTGQWIDLAMPGDTELSRGRIVEVNDDSIVVDFNHPAAGADIRLSGKILQIRYPESSELLSRIDSLSSECCCWID